MRGGISVQYTLVRLWIFSITLTLQRKGRIFKCSGCAIEKISREETETVLQRPGVGLTGSSTERMSANTWSNATPTRHSGFINTFHCYYSWDNWHSAAPDAHISLAWYLQESLKLHSACEVQSRFLFYGLISIKPCCWLGTLTHRFFENQYRTDTFKKETKSSSVTSE